MPAAAPCPSDATRYQRREPETTCLYGIVTRNLKRCLSHAQEKSVSGYGYPSFVEREFTKYLDCGQLRHGFVRVQCTECTAERLVAFTCKTRGICPSCTARRMSHTAAHLVDHVLPYATYRQWVLSFPKRVRFALAKDPALLSRVLDTALKKLFAWQKRRARRLDIPSPMAGAVTFVQRFGSLVNLNVHFHSLLADGVFFENANKQVHFRHIPPPSKDDIERLVLQIAKATEKELAQHQEWATDNEESEHLVPIVPKPRSPANTNLQIGPKAHLCAFLQGYSLHAERIVLPEEREELERLCRYGARAPIANSRLSLDENGNAVVTLKRPYFDGRTELKFTQLELMQKLAILIPPPWKNLTRYHGVFAPNHSYRSAIVDIGRPEPTFDCATKDSAQDQARPRRLPWAMLLRRVFAIDVLQCQACQGTMKIIAVIPASDASEAILNHLARTEPQARSTGPPLSPV